MKPDRDPLASHQIPLVTVCGLCVSERVDRGVGRHPEPGRLRISNYFCLGTYASVETTPQAPSLAAAKNCWTRVSIKIWRLSTRYLSTSPSRLVQRESATYA